MSVADYDIYIKPNSKSDDLINRYEERTTEIMTKLYFDIKKEKQIMKRSKAQIEKEIIDNVNESDVLQKANKILESMKAEELKKENPNNFTFEHGNDYLAHLKAIYQLNVLQESNREKIGELGLEYINLKKELLGYAT